MKRVESHKESKKADKKHRISWLVFFYSIPSKPVKNRVRIWRRLTKAGAVQLKGSVYVLPNNEDNREFFQWAVNEITEMKGEAAFLVGDKIETIKDREIVELFNQQREKEYRIIEKGFGELEAIVNSFKKGTRLKNKKKYFERFSKLQRDFEEIREIDFFLSETGKILKNKIDFMEKEIMNLADTHYKKEQRLAVKTRDLKDYQGKKWVTRKKPFVDRMASAWLIKEFIDREATFHFMADHEIENRGRNTVAFDVQKGEFTHTGNMCTFEVLLKSFRLKERVLRKIAHIVHELDLRDEKFRNAEARGIEEILAGIRRTAKDDHEILEKGMAVFGMLYASKI